MAATVAPAATAIPVTGGVMAAMVAMAADTGMDTVAATDVPPAATADTATDACLSRLFLQCQDARHPWSEATRLV